VLHTPGHSPGSVTLWCPQEKIALVGDTLFLDSIGRIDFPTSDPEAMRDSLHRVLMALPDDTRVCPGHGPDTTIGRERRSNPFIVQGF
jgi:glyoxylase-like metal-dependent hydrolase (beta-lactamase superfamily II)